MNKTKEPSALRVILVTAFLKTAIRLIARVDADELEAVPESGPLILCINHINFLEVPLIQTWLMPRKLRGFVKRETWENPFMAFLSNTYKAIPVDRGGINREAFKEIRGSLLENNIIVVAPEGTRSGNGVLQEGKPGITTMALMTGAPILPIVHFGGEKFWDNFSHLRRTTVKLKVGKPFILNSEQKPNSDIREEMTRAIMYQMAQLLPEDLRGSYSNQEISNHGFLEFI